MKKSVLVSVVIIALLASGFAALFLLVLEEDSQMEEASTPTVEDAAQEALVDNFVNSSDEDTLKAANPDFESYDDQGKANYYLALAYAQPVGSVERASSLEKSLEFDPTNYANFVELAFSYIELDMLDKLESLKTSANERFAGTDVTQQEIDFIQTIGVASDAPEDLNEDNF